MAVYGRRRVGKTFLVREYFQDCLYFELTGVRPAPPSTWHEAFGQLVTF